MTDFDETWLSLEETGAYIGVGKTALYAMARAGSIPARKLGKKWTFEKAGLDAWMRGHRPMQSFFTDIEFKIQGNDELRDPQREGYLRTSEYLRSGKNKAILQITVGCGKRAERRYCRSALPRAASLLLHQT